MLAFDTPIDRPDIVGMRLKAEGSELRVAVVLIRADDSTFEDVVKVPPADVPAQMKNWIESYCRDALAAKYGGA